MRTKEGGVKTRVEVTQKDGNEMITMRRVDEREDEQKEKDERKDD